MILPYSKMLYIPSALTSC